ncbi:MAG: carbonate dehydratase [Calditrichia bacterium]
MIHSNPWGDTPEISPQAYIHPTAVITGKVIIKDNCFVGANAVIRADEKDENGNIEPVVIHENSNIQDGVIIHTTKGKKVEIGPNVSITHGAVVHGPCILRERCFIGFNAVVYNAVLDSNVVVLHNAVVEMVSIPANKVVPPNGTILSTNDFSQLLAYSDSIEKFINKVLHTYEQLTFGYISQNKG